MSPRDNTPDDPKPEHPIAPGSEDGDRPDRPEHPDRPGGRPEPGRPHPEPHQK